MSPTADQYDLVIVGGGPGGYAAALYAAGAGLNVAVIEKDKVGGTCLHRGCIPAKAFLETASMYRHVADAKEHGIEAGQPVVQFSTSQQRKQKVVDQLWKGLQGLMKARKITTLAGTGRLLPNRVVEVTAADGSKTQVTGDDVIIAAGSIPRVIPGFEPDAPTIMTSDEVLMLTELPRSAVVIGGGAIGCEFASMMADLGTQVTIVEALPKILPGCDEDVVAVVQKSFKKRGIETKVGVQVKGHTKNADGQGTTVHMADGTDIATDAVIVSVGRKPATQDLIAPGTSVQLDQRGFVEVDANLRTGEPNVWAIGDVIATPQLAHVGFAEAIYVVRQMLNEPAQPVEYSKVPWCIYSHPEVAFVGMSETAAKEAGYDVVSKKEKLIGNGRSIIVGETDGLIKIIAEKLPDGSGGQILGVHMVGPWVTEQLGAPYYAVNWEATVADAAYLIQPHPSISEGFGETMLALTGRGLHG